MNGDERQKNERRCDDEESDEKLTEYDVYTLLTSMRKIFAHADLWKPLVELVVEGRRKFLTVTCF